MRTTLPLYLIIGASLLLGACGSTVASKGVATAVPPRTEAYTAAPSPLVRATADLQRDYQRSDWSGVRSTFRDSQIATTIIGLMRRWKQAGVSNLRVDLVYSQRVGSGQYVGTIKFSQDPRTIPIFEVLLFRVDRGRATVMGTASGIQGNNLLHANWRVTRSAHFVIYHSPYQLAGSDAAYLADLEYQRSQFSRKFGISVPSTIAYYLFPQQQMMSRMTLRTCGSRPENVGCATPFATPPSIEATIWPTYHEPIHIFERALEPSVKPGAQEVYVAPLFIAEGTAVALEDREADPNLSDYCSIPNLRYVPLDVCARVAITRVKPIELLSDSGFGQSDPGYAYSLGGSFVKYLILRYGYHNFGRFYYSLAAQPRDTLNDYNAATTQVYHRSIRSVIQAWSADLCREGC